MRWKKIAKWTVGVVGALAITAFLAFLYFIPPLTTMAPEEFIRPEAAAPPAVDNITDPKTRAIAERGRYIVLTTECTGCHTPAGANGPDFARYLSGGVKASYRGHGTFVSTNLTPDAQTGLGRRSDEEVVRVLRGGVSADGRVIWYRDMPWAWFSNWTEEDRYAVLTYLRTLKAVPHRIPPAEEATQPIPNPAALEHLSGVDWGTTP